MTGGELYQLLFPTRNTNGESVRFFTMEARKRRSFAAGAFRRAASPPRHDCFPVSAGINVAVGSLVESSRSFITRPIVVSPEQLVSHVLPPRVRQPVMRQFTRTSLNLSHTSLAPSNEVNLLLFPPYFNTYMHVRSACKKSSNANDTSKKRLHAHPTRITSDPHTPRRRIADRPGAKETRSCFG